MVSVKGANKEKHKELKRKEKNEAKMKEDEYGHTCILPRW